MPELRYYEGGKRKHVAVGTQKEFPTESAIRKSAKVQAILLGANSASPMIGNNVTMGTLVARYEAEEMPKRYSTGSAYRSYLDCHIKPRWENTSIQEVKPMGVEAWLNKLALAPKTKGHIRGLMHLLFDCAMRWELTDKNPISLVRVKGGTKREVQPRILETGEFQRLAAKIGEPYRTMVVVAGCLGLRVTDLCIIQRD